MEPFAHEVRDREKLSTARGAAQPQRRSDRLTTLAGITILLLVVVLAAAATKSFRELTRAHDREDALGVEIATTERRVEGLGSENEALRDDPMVLERLAREDLGLAMPGDIVIVTPEPGRD